MVAKVPLDPTAAKITTQYFLGEVRVCELESAAGTLDVRVSQAAAANWTIEVRSKRTADTAAIVGSGTTSAAALTAAAAEWAAQSAFLGLETFNWTSVAEALQAVHAIR
jgi:hypothetical protein